MKKQNHNRRICSGDKYWEGTSKKRAPKFIARGDALNFCFGKHKGKDALTLNDPGYLKWVLKNVDGIENRHRAKIQETIKS